MVGNPKQLLSVNLPASWTLYTRRGSLLGLSGDVEKAKSKMSVVDYSSLPTRIITGMPFLYQQISSKSPLNILIAATSSRNSGMATIDMDGRIDWMVVKPSSLLAWVGPTLSVRPRISRSSSSPSLGALKLTGRGQAAIVGNGQILQIDIAENDSYIIHPKYEHERYINKYIRNME